MTLEKPIESKTMNQFVSLSVFQLETPFRIGKLDRLTDNRAVAQPG